MAGKIKQMIDQIIAQQSKGNPTVANLVKTKLILKGINPDKYTGTSDDDESILTKLQSLAKELSV